MTIASPAAHFYVSHLQHRFVKALGISARGMLVSELDVTKEKIAYLKVWLGILVVTDISLVGWFVSNIVSANSIALVS
jgi:hypothetical protein